MSVNPYFWVNMQRFNKFLLSAVIGFRMRSAAGVGIVTAERHPLSSTRTSGNWEVPAAS